MSLRSWLGLGPQTARPELGWDYHCHLLPGVDDGARTLEEAREMITGLRALGYRGGVLTPHIYDGVYANTSASLRTAFAAFKAAIGDEYQLWLAAEYHTTDAFFELIKNDDLLFLPVGRDRLVLVEFPYLMPNPRGLEALAAVRHAGYQPVLAHVERYRYIQSDPKPWLADLARHEVWIQCNIGSLGGMYGDRPRKLAQHLLDAGLPVLWSTDVHRISQIERYVSRGLVCLERLAYVNGVLDRM